MGGLAFLSSAAAVLAASPAGCPSGFVHVDGGCVEATAATKVFHEAAELQGAPSSSAAEPANERERRKSVLMGDGPIVVVMTVAAREDTAVTTAAVARASGLDRADFTRCTRRRFMIVNRQITTSEVYQAARAIQAAGMAVGVSTERAVVMESSCPFLPACDGTGSGDGLEIDADDDTDTGADALEPPELVVEWSHDSVTGTKRARRYEDAKGGKDNGKHRQGKHAYNIWTTTGPATGKQDEEFYIGDYLCSQTSGAEFAASTHVQSWRPAQGRGAAVAATVAGVGAAVGALLYRYRSRQLPAAGTPLLADQL